MEKAPQEPKKPLGPQELHNFEDREARWQDELRWDSADYAYIGGWDYLVPDMDDKTIEDLTRYAG